jgi:hypothetical protein
MFNGFVGQIETHHLPGPSGDEVFKLSHDIDIGATASWKPLLRSLLSHGRCKRKVDLDHSEELYAVGLPGHQQVDRMPVQFFKLVEGQKVPAKFVDDKLIPFDPVSSNEKDLTQKTTPQEDEQTIQTNGMPHSETPKPFIDKLTVILTFKSAKQASETHGVLHQNLTGGTEYFDTVCKPLKGFKLARLIALPDCPSHPRIDYSYSNDAGLADRIRLEFNPSKLGIDGLRRLHDILSLVIEGGWQVFVTDGRISRLDVAVDLVGVRMTKLKVVPPKAMMSQTWSS